MLEDIIRMFKEKDGFLSGEEMSRRLGITRSAVWKKMKSLRDKGFEIEGSTAKGYKLIKSPEFSIEELKTLIKGDFGKEIVFRETIDSTNTLATELAEKGVAHGTLVLADNQTKGKGRLGRMWLSPPKSNIYMSIILRPEIAPKDATMLTMMSAVAAANAVRKATGLKADIKWPNDLLVSDKKLGGILTELKSDPDRVIFSVIGIGINVNIKQNNFPSDIRPIATSVREEMGKSYPRTLLIAGILEEMEKWYKVLIKKGRMPVLEEWKKLSSTLGRKVKATVGNEIFTGTATDIDEEGMLILKLQSGVLKRISAGDITMLR